MAKKGGKKKARPGGASPSESPPAAPAPPGGGRAVRLGVPPPPVPPAARRRGCQGRLPPPVGTRREPDRGDTERRQVRGGARRGPVRGDARAGQSGSSSESDDEGAADSKPPKTERAGEADAAGDDSMEARIAYLNALSRGDVDATSSSSEDESSSSSDSSDSDSDSDESTSGILGKAGVLDPSSNRVEDVDLTDEESRYLCVLNLNWDHVRAVDVYAMVRSFCPPGTLERVAVYPSDFGRGRMEREGREGPRGLWKRAARGEEGEGGDGEDAGESDGGDGTTSRSDSEGDSDGEPDEYQEPLQAGVNPAEDDGSDSDEEDILNLEDATSRLYSHFPAQSTVTKNSQLTTADEEEDGFDIERLRRYEASKLRYYFAVATFSSPRAASSVYESIDGLEMGHTAAEVDARILPADAYASTVEGREVRDECTQVPARYEPSDAVVTALRQSRVSCSWEEGDAEREARLTRYGMGKEGWEAMAAGDDIGVYLATSDVSSDEGGSDGEERGGTGGEKRKGKADKMRAMLGLAGSDDDDDEVVSSDSEGSSGSGGSSDGEDDDGEAAERSRQVTFTPGGDLEAKIRAKLSKEDGGEKKELSPFEKYLERRKEKRRERRQAARGRKGGAQAADDDGGMYDQDHEFGEAKFSDEEDGADGTRGGDGPGDGDGGFFAGGSDDTKTESEENADGGGGGTRASTREELELLIAGDAGLRHAWPRQARASVDEEAPGQAKEAARGPPLERLRAGIQGRHVRLALRRATRRRRPVRHRQDRPELPGDGRDEGAPRGADEAQEQEEEGRREGGGGRGDGQGSAAGPGGQNASGSAELSSLVMSLKRKRAKA
ncbi:hypothetical protein THAOC_13452 [Thalassiosira oceanica]|uniref:ESF1 RRM domain-containing protein n=1 Tax=Thalassiosira oceanica TaxID=159749 RepID=K0SL40_THAOC|nr:hypothetical protein THAOC_13452 [Thalassiosira oceanica]|eukprot:EJK65664.1 hypothetical protein THAOC_13452 [Thalassiosira oceanica]